ncbi:hypothetical protein RHODOSMS8_00052 [Rhodobiaceae bacterium]|nr:hypothetical protein RHODOSMS8_00052 [Rhodobiaceae bacterium]
MDPWTLGGVEDMIRDDLAFGLFATCNNPKCDKCDVPVRLDLYDLVKRFGRGHPKREIRVTCILCKYAGRDRTQTTISVGMRDQQGRWLKALSYCREPHRTHWFRPYL